MKGDARALRRLGDAVRVVLLHGPDAGASADLARFVTRAARDPNDPFAHETVIDAATLASDPAALVAAASAVPMFGGRVVVRVDGAGEESSLAVERIFQSATATSLVVIVAGSLKRGSRLLARVEQEPSGLAVASYAPDASTAIGIAGELAGGFGVRLARDAAAALVTATGGDRAIIRQEVAKLALFLDAAPDAVRTATLDDIAAIAAEYADADLGKLVDSVFGGAPSAVAHQLAELQATSGIALLRAVLRRLWTLLDARAAVDGGASAATAIGAARPPIYGRERDAIAAQIARWPQDRLCRALDRVLDAERQVKRSGSAGDVAVDQLLMLLAVEAHG